MLETFRGERLRLSIVAILLGISLVPWVVAWMPLVLEGDRWAPDRSSLWALTVVGGLAFAYELHAVSVVWRVMRLGRRISRGRRYRNALVETSVPTLMLVIAGAISRQIRRQFATARCTIHERDRTTSMFGQHVSPAIGDVVKVASRLEQMNKDLGTRALASRSVVGQMQSGSAHTTPTGSVAVRAREHPIDVFGGA